MAAPRRHGSTPAAARMRSRCAVWLAGGCRWPSGRPRPGSCPARTPAPTLRLSLSGGRCTGLAASLLLAFAPHADPSGGGGCAGGAAACGGACAWRQQRSRHRDQGPPQDLPCALWRQVGMAPILRGVTGCSAVGARGPCGALRRDPGLMRPWNQPLPVSRLACLAAQGEAGGARADAGH